MFLRPSPDDNADNAALHFWLDMLFSAKPERAEKIRCLMREARKEARESGVALGTVLRAMRPADIDAAEIGGGSSDTREGVSRVAFRGMMLMTCVGEHGRGQRRRRQRWRFHGRARLAEP